MDEEVENAISDAESQSGECQADKKKRKGLADIDQSICLRMPTTDSCQQTSPFLSGTAIRAIFGPRFGAVNVVTSKIAYLLQVALPGVGKGRGEFCIEVYYCGRVHIKGVVYGGTTEAKDSSVSQKKSQQPCPPRPFSMTFTLPGPVFPKILKPGFRSDDTFQGIVAKFKSKKS